MLFSSLPFLFLFLPVALIGHYILHPKLRNAFLLVMSLGFYAYGEPKFVLIMMASIVLNYISALLVQWAKKHSLFWARTALAFIVACNLSILFVYKYLNFTVSNLSLLFGGLSIGGEWLQNLILPIGISFFTFQGLSYVVDVYRDNDVAAEKNPINVGLYIALFPQLIAGPIVRYTTVNKEIQHRTFALDDFSQGSVRFVQGLAKKIILSNNLALVADAGFGAGDLSVGFAWLAALAYALQIYFDFSGYSDMAIGLGRMFGFHFEENFNHPYLSKSVTEFWRRWHISLSSWFRDYVYIPLGGSRVKTKARHIGNLLVVWFLTGLWHGASWNFIIWGLMYFILLVVEKFWIHPERMTGKGQRLSWRIVTLCAVLFGWVLFRAPGITQGFSYMAAMFGLRGNALIDNTFLFHAREYLGLLLLAITFSTNLPHKLAHTVSQKLPAVLSQAVSACVYIFLVLMCISYLVIGAHNPFIYFNF